MVDADADGDDDATPRERELIARLPAPLRSMSARDVARVAVEAFGIGVRAPRSSRRAWRAYERALARARVDDERGGRRARASASARRLDGFGIGGGWIDDVRAVRTRGAGGVAERTRGDAVRRRGVEARERRFGARGCVGSRGSRGGEWERTRERHEIVAAGESRRRRTRPRRRTRGWTREWTREWDVGGGETFGGANGPARDEAGARCDGVSNYVRRARERDEDEEEDASPETSARAKKVAKVGV